MVQGSAISAVMSNIYMIKFDKLVNDLITSNNGIYRRYSDDIIIIIPSLLMLWRYIVKVMQTKDSVPRLELSPDKTKCFYKKGYTISSVDLKRRKWLKNKTIIDYLGFFIRW